MALGDFRGRGVDDVVMAKPGRQLEPDIGCKQRGQHHTGQHDAGDGQRQALKLAHFPGHDGYPPTGLL